VIRNPQFPRDIQWSYSTENTRFGRFHSVLDERAGTSFEFDE
jgi:hypothetical protein